MQCKYIIYRHNSKFVIIFKLQNVPKDESQVYDHLITYHTILLHLDVFVGLMYNYSINGLYCFFT